MFEKIAHTLAEVFKKQPYTLEDISKMQDDGQLPGLIVYAVPIMIGFVILEYMIGQYRKRKLYQGKDFWASVGIGVGNLLSSALTNTVMFAIVLFFYNLSPWTIPVTWWSFILCLICLDFFRYWAHKVGHENRVFWATHVTHHSSELYNFSVSFRLSWVQQIKVIFFLPVALMGFHPVLFFVCHQIEVLYQFWIHTEMIRKLPKPIEYIFVTPSHHRVHHGRNPQYIDRNYGSTFIIWDRIFGTFQEEIEQPDYGITTPPNSYNPVFLVFHEFLEIGKELKQAETWKDRYDIVFAYPGTFTNRLAEKRKQKEAASAAPAPVIASKNPE